MARPFEYEQTTFCRVCEATCGMKVRARASRAVGIEPYRGRVTSRGYACIEGTRFGEVQHGPDRVLQPMKGASGSS